MRIQQFLCWDENREQDEGITFECFDSQEAAEEAAECFNSQDVEYPLEKDIFAKGPDGVTEKFTVYMEQIPSYSAVKIEHEPEVSDAKNENRMGGLVS